MDFRQMKNDAYGIGQRRGMGNALGGGLGDFSSSYSGGGGYNGGNYGGGGGGNQGGYGGNRNESPDSGNYNRGGGGGNFDGGPRSNNNYSRSIDDRGFNANINNNQRFGNVNDNFQDNFRGQSDNFGPSNRGGGGGSGGMQSNLQRMLDLEDMRSRNTGDNFNSDLSNNYRGQQSQGSGDRFYNDSPRNQGNFGGNSGSNYGPNDGPPFGGNNDNFRSPQQSQNFNDQQRSGYNDSYGRGGNFGGQNSGNFGNQDSGNFGGNFGGQNFNDNFNNRGSRGGGGFNNSGGGGGFNNSGGGGGFNNSGGGGGFNNSGGGFNNSGSERGQGGYNSSGSGFSNNISRSFNEANSRNWSNQTNQSSSFQNSGYQSNNSGGGGGQAISGWEASQRAFNSKRNQLQKINVNNGGAVRKPGPQQAVKAVYNMRNNPNAATAVTNAAGRNTQPNKAGNVRPGTAAGVQNKAPNQYKLVNTATKTNSAGAVQKKPPIAGQAIKASPGAVKGGTQLVKKGPSVAGTGQQGGKPGPQGVRASPQGVRAGPQGVRAGPQGVRAGAPRVRPGPQGVRPGPQGVRPGPPGVRPGPQGIRPGPQGGPVQGIPRGPKAGNPAAGPNKPPNAPGIPPQVGQKRVATAPPLETEPVSKSVKKWRRVARKRGFLMGGFKLPYLNDHPKKLPQPESESYALTFFEQVFNYSTNQEAVDEDFSEEALLLNDLSDDESTEEVKVARKGGKKSRKRIRGEWAPLHESKSYKEWNNWWKDYKQFGDKIEKKLVEIGNYNLEHCFLPNLPKMTTEEVVYAIIKSAHFVLEKNADVPFDTMKTIFTLMNRTFLENITELNMLEVQDIIRNIPNDLWVYKMKSMIFLWSKYETIHSSKSTDEEIVKDQQSTIREWKSPAFHWLAKQAFDELVAISETEWKEHRTIFPALE
ncbi:hypothetical protein KR200_008074 [Drosophila serrata]|nr:hypothetical protein KR200_008074 [Drosophila serrata]